MTARSLHHGSDKVARDLNATVASELARIGLFCRVFCRVKDPQSSQKKKNMKSYGMHRKLQDAIGIRIALYFADDVDVTIDAIKRVFPGRYVDCTRDVPRSDSFCPVRTNLIFRLNENELSQVELVRANPDWIDPTFEVQVRTVLSEGWHEVDHDLRYKCKADWIGQDDLDRSLNGMMATLETCDWAMLQLFDELALRHYRNENWAAMLRCKLRVRMEEGIWVEGVRELLGAEKEIAKQLFRVERGVALQRLAKSGVAIPSTCANWLFILNQVSACNPKLAALAPEPIAERLKQI